MEYFNINYSNHLKYSILIKNNFREFENINLFSNKTTEGFIEGMFDMYEKKLKPLYQEQTQLNNEIKTLNEEINNKQQVLLKKKNQLNFLTINVLTTDYKSSYTTTQQDINVLTKEITNLQKQLDTKNTSVNKVNDKISKLENSKRMQKDNFSLDEYKPKVSTSDCSFYFNTNSYNCIYSVLTNDINIYVETNIILNESNSCFNTDGNVLYSNIDNTIYSFNTINNVGKKYSVLFNIIINNSTFIICLLKFIENSFNTSSIIINVDSDKNTVKLSSLDKQNNCIIYLKKTNLNISVQNNLDHANIKKIVYLDKEIDLNKKYTYGRLSHSGNHYYDCIVLNI